MASPDDVVAVAVAVTFCEPSLRIVGELSVNTRFAAVAHIPDEDVQPGSAPSPNGGVPALPLPPQPTTNALVKSAATQIKLFMNTSQPVLEAYVSASARPFGR